MNDNLTGIAMSKHSWHKTMNSLIYFISAFLQLKKCLASNYTHVWMYVHVRNEKIESVTGQKLRRSCDVMKYVYKVWLDRGQIFNVEFPT
jgi:hypothetical protein